MGMVCGLILGWGRRSAPVLCHVAKPGKVPPSPKGKDEGDEVSPTAESLEVANAAPKFELQIRGPFILGWGILRSQVCS